MNSFDELVIVANYNDIASNEIDDENYDFKESSSEQTGRWTKAEHELFLKALDKYGKEWKKVASMVKTRTVVQTRTHAQKYFQKKAKSGDGVIFFGSDDEGTSSKRASNAHSTAFNSAEKKKLKSTSSREEINGVKSYIYEDPPQALTLLKTPVLSTWEKQPPSHLELPSPAATGRRKLVEIAVAQTLAASAAQDSSDSDSVSCEELKSVTESSKKSNLSFIDPNHLDTHDNGFKDSGTPWESDIHSLRDNIPFDDTLGDYNEYKHFLLRIKTAIKLLDKNELTSALDNINKITFDANRISSMQGPSTELKPCLNTAFILNICQPSGIPILLEICDIDNINQSDLLPLCKILVSYGACVRVSDRNGCSCLHLLARRGHEKIGQFLLSKGCNINKADNFGNTACHIASKYGNIEFVKMLLELGAHCHIHNNNALSALDIAGSECLDKKLRKDLRHAMFKIEPRLRTLVLYHDECLFHKPTRMDNWDCGQRVLSIIELLKSSNLYENHEIEISNHFERASVELLSRVHSPDYLKFLNSICITHVHATEDLNSLSTVDESEKFVYTPLIEKFLGHIHTPIASCTAGSNTNDPRISSGTLIAARRAVGAVSHAVDCVLLGRNRNAFCVVRPPGNNCGYEGLLKSDNLCGFSVFNSVAAGALHALEVHHCQRVAIIDLCVNHGNGTEDIVRRFHQPSRLFFCSLHLFDNNEYGNSSFFPGTGSHDDIVNNVINIPLAPLWVGQRLSNYTHSSSLRQATDVGREAYRQAVVNRLIPSLRAFNPSLIILSNGFDCFAEDIGNHRFLCRNNDNTVTYEQGMNLTLDDIQWITTEIVRVADLCCHGRLVTVLEGGYGSLRESVLTLSECNRLSRSAHNASEEIDRSLVNISEDLLDHSCLSSCAMSHVSRLIDPYDNSSS